MRLPQSLRRRRSRRARRPGPSLPDADGTPVDASHPTADAGLASPAGEWTTCSLKLDEAKGLDPAGGSEPRAVEARRDIADAGPLDQKPEKPEKLNP